MHGASTGCAFHCANYAPWTQEQKKNITAESEGNLGGGRCACSYARLGPSAYFHGESVRWLPAAPSLSIGQPRHGPRSKRLGPPTL